MVARTPHGLTATGPMDSRRALLLLASTSGLMCCTLVVSTKGLSGGPAAIASDASIENEASVEGDAADATAPDGSPDGSPDAGETFVSCAAAKAVLPFAADGPQTIDPDGVGPLPPFAAWCDMTQDGGGWMLVNADMLANTSAVAATEVRSMGDHDGMVIRVFANNVGCGMGGPRTEHRFVLKDPVPWTRIRVHQIFAGEAGCWHIWGASGGGMLGVNLTAFTAGTDIIRDAVRMGGSAGDAFDGMLTRCDSDPANFWFYGTTELRSATVVLRRPAPNEPSGIATGADCSKVAPGSSSPTWWEYRDIYVK